MSATHSDALVLFGVTGDFSHKMIFPALYALVKRDALKVPVIGVASPRRSGIHGGILWDRPRKWRPASETGPR